MRYFDGANVYLNENTKPYPWSVTTPTTGNETEKSPKGLMDLSNHNGDFSLRTFLHSFLVRSDCYKIREGSDLTAHSFARSPFEG